MQAVTPVPQEATIGRSKEIPVVHQILQVRIYTSKFAEIFTGQKESKCIRIRILFSHVRNYQCWRAVGTEQFVHVPKLEFN